MPVYNAAKYIRRCLESAVSQQYDNFKIGVIDGGSTDGTVDIVEEFGLDLIHNDPSTSCPVSNLILGSRTFSDNKEDILVTLDGDDYLSGPDVLSHLNVVYSDPNVWLTYGQFQPLSGKYKNFCRPVPDTRKYRLRGNWYTSHIRTYKRWLWDLVKDEDLRDPEGGYCSHAGDCAIMFPMIEMAGNKHILLVTKTLYMYNDLNPMNEYKVTPYASRIELAYLMKKPLYPELKEKQYER